MLSLILELKYVVLVILVCEFLKELLTAEKFKQYIHFAVSLFLFAFFLTTFLHTDFSLPDFTGQEFNTNEENLLKAQYEQQIAETISNQLTNNNIPCRGVTVLLSDAYEIEKIQITSTQSPEQIQSILKGDFPYEVVYPLKETIAP